MPAAFGANILICHNVQFFARGKCIEPKLIEPEVREIVIRVGSQMTVHLQAYVNSCSQKCLKSTGRVKKSLQLLLIF